jgi:DNA polymerase-3 subunit epsilon
MVDNAPPVDEVVPQLLEFIGSDPLSAHNASFDDKFLRAEAERLDLTPRYASLVCSLKLSRRVFPELGSYKLGHLSGALGIRFNSAAHRAEADAEVAAKLLVHIGGHLRSTYGIRQVDSELLVSVNKLAAAKVPQFLQKRGQPV